MHQPAIFAPLLESVLNRSGADGVYVYRLENAGGTARLAAWAGVAPTADFTAVHGRAAREHVERRAPIVLHKQAWGDARFASFPEFWSQRFEGVVSIPLVHDGAILGVLNLCRREPESLPAPLAAYLFDLSLPLGALLAAGSANETLRQEAEALAQKLADRKLLERAKGLLQARFDWTEEEAYLYLRRSSRQRRTALREIAIEVIERVNLHMVEERRAS